MVDKVLGPGPTREFFVVRAARDNVLDSNLTELAAAESVDRGFVNHNDWLAHVMRYQYVLNHVKGGESLLDVGCGRLQLPYYAYRNRWPVVREYWGLDLRAADHWLLDVGWKAPINLVRADFAVDADRIEALPGWPRHGFERVVYLEAHEHVGTRDFQREAAYNLYEWTAKGGLVFFSTPNAGVSDSTADNHTAPDGSSREWTFEDKRSLVEEVGFEVVEAFGTFGAVRRLPAAAWDDPSIQAARRYMSTSMFTNFAFLQFPAAANNAIFKLRKP